MEMMFKSSLMMKYYELSVVKRSVKNITFFTTEYGHNEDKYMKQILRKVARLYYFCVTFSVSIPIVKIS